MPAIPLVSGRFHYHPTITQDEISRIANQHCTLREVNSIWDRIKDWFCNTNKTEAKQCLHKALAV